MKKLLTFILLGLGVAVIYYWGFLAIYFVELIILFSYALAAFILLLVGFYVKDRIAYYKLRKQMWKEAHS